MSSSLSAIGQYLLRSAKYSNRTELRSRKCNPEAGTRYQSLTYDVYLDAVQN